MRSNMRGIGAFDFILVTLLDLLEGALETVTFSVTESVSFVVLQASGDILKWPDMGTG